MGIIQRLKSLGQSQQLNFTSDGSSGEVVRNYGKKPAFRPQDQLRGLTYKAIDKIATTTSTYEPQVKKVNGDTYENHPLYKLFYNPRPFMSGADFVHLWTMLQQIYGETFWYKVRGELTGKIKELILLPPNQMELVIDDGEVVGYILHKSNGQNVPFTLDEVYHDKRANPFNEFRGMSIMERVSTYIDIELVTSTYTLNYMHNNASPSGIVSLPSMTPESFTKFTRQWRENYEGPGNAGKTAFIRGSEASFKAVGATLKDIDQKVTREMAEQDVLMAFEVPKPLLGVADSNGLGRGNVETLEYIFTKHTIEPLMNRLDNIYTSLLKEVRNANDLGAYVDHESIIPEDKEYEHTVNKDLVNVAITVNEVRARLGLPPIKGGDDLMPANQVQQPQKSIKVQMKQAKTESEINKQASADQEAFRAKLVETNSIYEVKVKRAISKFTAGKEKEVIAKINASSKTYDEWLYNVKEASEELAVILMPIMKELMDAQVVDIANFITGELIAVTPELIKLVENRIKEISGVYNTDTILKLQETLAEGQASGESLVKLKKRVEEVFDGAKGYRAERIARTESLHTSNLTAEYSYKQSGYTKLRYFANPGACEFCRALDGTTRELGTNFVNLGGTVTGDEGGLLAVSYADIDVPPTHVNCRCSIVPEV